MVFRLMTKFFCNSWLPCFFLYVFFFFLIIEDYETCSSLLIPIGLNMNNNKRIIILALSPCCCYLFAVTFYGTYIQSKKQKKMSFTFPSCLYIWIFLTSKTLLHTHMTWGAHVTILPVFFVKDTGRVMLRTDGSPKNLFSISVSAVQLKVSLKSRKNRHGKSSPTVECPSFCSQFCWECYRTLWYLKSKEEEHPHSILLSPPHRLGMVLVWIF